MLLLLCIFKSVSQENFWLILYDTRMNATNVLIDSQSVLIALISEMSFVTLCYGLKGQGHVTVNKPVISIIYIVAHTWPLCSVQILVDGVNPR